MRSYNPDSNTKPASSSVGAGLVPALFMGDHKGRPYNDVCFVLESVWALPRSLVATQGISVDFYSSGY